ncbi:MAG: molybdopterin-guanine dinucleotide biosynthesis protein A [Alphaproteobacteria bacterium]|nr:molybdopterin-guanine dinucleotide biosynthesis protein A [Alphaproteobacteria bacterium SS10]
MSRFACLLAALFLLLAMPVMAQADDDIEADDARHAGYYYPEPDEVEAYKPRSRVMPDSSRERRIGFTTVLATQLLKEGQPRLAIFAKGAEAEKLIIVGLEDGFLSTIYRVRAMLAMMTAAARSTPMLQEMAVADIFTFLDVLNLLGFDQITISDGDEFAHTIVFQPDDDS